MIDRAKCAPAVSRATLMPSPVYREDVPADTRATLKLDPGVTTSCRVVQPGVEEEIVPAVSRATLRPSSVVTGDDEASDPADSRATLRPSPEVRRDDETGGPADSRATLRPDTVRIPTQSQNPHEYMIVGTDVEALFPSLTDLESARVAREAVETSDITFQNIDVAAALQYLRINGGDDYINDCGFKRIAPRWLGPRPDLLTVGGDSMNEVNKWTKMKTTLNDHEIRLVIARVVETAVLVCINTHIYSFGPNLYVQCTGGPIGMRFTASLASIVMKEWDKAWIKLLKRENIDFDMFIRYV